MKILVFQTAFLGDLLLSIPLLKNIKRIYPNAQLELICRKPFRSFFLSTNLVDKAYELNKKDKKETSSIIHSLKSTNYDIIFCPHESFHSAYIVGQLNGKEKVSFRRWFSRFYFDIRVPRPIELSDALRQMALLVPFDEKFALDWIQSSSDFRSFRFQKMTNFGEFYEVPDWASMTVPIPEDLKFFADNLKDLDFSNSVILAPGSVWNTKQWKEEHFINIGRSLSKRGFKILLVGSAKENLICKKIEEAVPGALNLCSRTTLEDLFLILSKATALISNDSGTMHMGAAAGIPSVSAFGPTTLDIGYRPWQNQALVGEIDLKCRPCGKHGHQECPIKTHKCMQDLTPQYMESLLNKLINYKILLD